MKSSQESSNLAASSTRTIKLFILFVSFFYFIQAIHIKSVFNLNFIISIGLKKIKIKRQLRRTTWITPRIQGLGIQVHQYLKP